MSRATPPTTRWVDTPARLGGGRRQAGRPPGGGHRRQGSHGAGVGPGHRRPVGDPFTGHTGGCRGGGRRRARRAARSRSPAATMRRCGCGTWPPAPRSATRSPATPARVTAVAVGELDGRPVVVSGGGDATVRVWDLATGDPVGDPLTGHTGGVTAVAVGAAGRPPGRGHRRRRRDGAGVGPGHRRTRSATRSPATPTRCTAVAVGGARRAPGRGHRRRRRDGAGVGPGHRRTRSATRSPATPTRCARWRSAQLDGRPVAVTGSERRDGAGVGPGHRRPGRRPAHRPHRRGEAVASAQLDGRPVAVTGSDDGTVRVWDLATGDPGRRPAHRPHRLGAGGGGRRSWTAARSRSPAATTTRCGCGTWPPAPRSATPSPATPARCTRWRSGELRRAPGRGHRQRRRDGAGVGPGHRRPGRRPPHRPHGPGDRGGCGPVCRGGVRWQGAPVFNRGRRADRDPGGRRRCPSRTASRSARSTGRPCSSPGRPAATSPSGITPRAPASPAWPSTTPSPTCRSSLATGSPSVRPALATTFLNSRSRDAVSTIHRWPSGSVKVAV